LRHAFLAERRLSKTPEAGAEPRPSDHIGLIGGGRAGVPLVLAALAAGLKVSLIERDHDALIASLEAIADIHEAEVARGRLKPEKRDAEWARLSGSADLSRLAEADIIVEVVPEDAGLKAEIFHQLGPIAKPGAILATASAGLDVAALGQAAGRPADTLAFRPWTRITRTGLVEIGVTGATDPEAVATATALARRLGQFAVRTAGPLTGRMMAAWSAAADALLIAGATPARIDAALRAYGFPQGRYQAEDTIGLDTLSGLRRPALAGSHGPELADRLAAHNRTGRFAAAGRPGGAGWFDWPEGARRGQENDEVLALIEAERARLNRTAREVSDEEITLTCLLALVAEGTRLLTDATALRPSDIDMALLIGLGFPRWRGGPMLSADLMDLLEAKNALAALAPENPELWTPTELLAELIKNGRHFEDLNGV
jgi:3-hydroxyacyl-CoA dehydrogenase